MGNTGGTGTTGNTGITGGTGAFSSAHLMHNLQVTHLPDVSCAHAMEAALNRALQMSSP